MNVYYRNIIFVSFIIIFLIASFSPILKGKISENNIQSNSGNEIFLSRDSDKWTWIFYDDEDFPTGVSILDWFSEYAYSSENLDVIVLTDTYSGPANIWYINENHEKELLQQMGEINMGDYQTLFDFIEYSKNNFPASRYLLSLYDHGDGWIGACWDESNNDDFLSMNEIKNALAESGNVDIVAFTGPCLMSSLESVYELRENTDIYLGSEAIGFFEGWRYSINDICNLLNQYPETDNIEIGKRIIQFICENNIGREFDPVLTISAFRLDKINEFTESLDQILYDLCNDYEAVYSKIWNIRKELQSFPRTSQSYLVDIFHFLEKYLALTTNQSMITKLSVCMNLFDELIINEYHGNASFLENVHGSSLYFPDSPESSYDYRYDDPDFGLDFCKDIYWDEFLNIFLETQDNLPPQKPSISGPSFGKINEEQTFCISSVDPDEDQIYYWFDWGDDSDSGWLGPFESEEEIEASHIWIEKGNFEVKVKAKDVHGAESEWSDPLSVSMPKNKAINTLFLNFLENHPNLFPLLRQLLEL